MRINKLSLSVMLATTTLSSLTAESVYSTEYMLEEVIVTATRRGESIQDVPYNISALSGEAIKRSGADDLSSIVKRIPGVSFTDLGKRTSGINNGVVIRGLNANNPANNAVWPGAAVPLVSTYINDTPLFVNLKLVDVERLEVLRGPQGTLYGSGAMGGALRFILNKPDLEENSFDVSGKLSNTRGSDDLSKSANFVANWVANDNLAFRLAAGQDEQAGFIDAVNLAAVDAAGSPLLADPADPQGSGRVIQGADEDIDDARTKYARFTTLWKPNNDAEISFTYQHQEDNAGHSTSQSHLFDDFENAQYLKEPMERTVDLYALEMEYDLGFATLASSTSYVENESESTRGNTGIYQRVDAIFGCALYGCFPRMITPAIEVSDDDAFTQEFRLVSNADSALSWIVGGYYRKEDLSFMSEQFLPGWGEWAELPGTDPFSTGSFADFRVSPLGGAVLRPIDQPNAYLIDRAIDFEDMALFGEVSYQLSDSWQVTFGARTFRQDYQQTLTQVFANCGPACSDDGVNPLGVVNGVAKEEFKDQVYKVNTSYDLDNDTKVYFTWSEGFRHGGANALPTSGVFFDPNSSMVYEPDKATNWELGIKGTLIENTDYTLAAFLVEWDDFQLDTFNNFGLPLVVNAGEALSKGIELEVSSQITENLTVNFGYSYTKAELNEDVVVIGEVAEEGSQLPSVPEHQATLSADYIMPLDIGFELLFHLDGAYRDEVLTALGPSFTNYHELDKFTLWNGSISLTADKWSLGLFVNNISDKQPVYGRETRNEAVNPESSRDWIGRPRTVGLSMSYSF